VIIMLAVMSLMLSCGKDGDGVDTQYPSIDLSFDGAFPVQCSTVKRGETFVFRANFSDNVALGSYSLDIHHNFDYHTHSTEAKECDMDPVKAPVNPLEDIYSAQIPE